MSKSTAESGQRSLFGEILDWMLAPLLLIWPISVGLTWLVAQGIANKPYDRALGEMTRTLGLQVAAEALPGRSMKSRYALAPEAAALLRADETDTVFYQVLGLRGELLNGDSVLPVPPDDETIVAGELHFRDDEVGNERVRVVEDPFGQVSVLQVEDSGAGIAEHERDKVFQPFYRALGTNVDGSGLGLAIVREIAQQHEAEISLDDTRPRRAGQAESDGPGARFSVRFPAHPALTA